MQKINALLERAANYANATAGALILVLLIAQLVIVLMRYVFSVGVQWGQDLLVYLFMLSSILPLWLVILKNINVRVDVFYQNYATKTKRALDRFGLLCLLLPVCIYATWASLGPTLNSWSLLEASPTFGGLPGYFLLKTMLTVIFAGLTIIAVVLLLRPKLWDTEDQAGED